MTTAPPTTVDVAAEVEARLETWAREEPAWYEEAKHAAVRAEKGSNPDWVRHKASEELGRYLDRLFDSPFRDTSDHKALARELLLAEASARTAPALPSLAPAAVAHAGKPTNLQLLNRMKTSPQWAELGQPRHGDAQELVATWVLERGAMMCDKKDWLVKFYQSKHDGRGSRASIKRWLRSAVETGVLTEEQRPRSNGKWSTTIYRINPETLNSMTHGDPW